MSTENEIGSFTNGEINAVQDCRAVKDKPQFGKYGSTSPTEYDSVLDFDPSQSESEEGEGREEDSNKRRQSGTARWCKYCRTYLQTDLIFENHLKSHIVQPLVALTRIKFDSGRVPSTSSAPKKKPPIRIKLKKLNKKTSKQAAFKVVGRGGKLEVDEGSAKEEAAPRGEGGGPEGRAAQADEDSTGDSGVASPRPPPSPTPSETLRPRGDQHTADELTAGYLAMSPEGDRRVENGSLSPMSCISTASTVLFNPSRDPTDPDPQQASSGRSRDDRDRGDDEEDEDPEDDEEDSDDEEPPTAGAPAAPADRHKGDSGSCTPPTVGNITVRSAADLLSPQGLINSSVGQQPAPGGGAPDAFQALQGLVSDVQTDEGLKVLSPVDMGLLNGNGGVSVSPAVSGDPLAQQPTMAYSCDVCGETAPNRHALDMHKASVAHFRCPIGPDCPMFGSAMELASHYHAVHSGGGGGGPPSSASSQPVLQLQQQVQRLATTTQLPGGVTLVNRSGGSTPYHLSHHQHQQKSILLNRPQLQQVGVCNKLAYGSPYQVLQKGAPQVVLSGGSQQASSLPNLPPGVQLSKRPSSSGSAPTPPKQRRPSDDRGSEGSASPPIKLPDSITLMRPGVSITSSSSSSSVTSQKPQQQRSGDPSSVANMLATRGITVVPSSGRSNGASISSVRRNSSPQTSSPIANLNSAVSITPSPQRPGNFAVPGRSSRGSNSPLTNKLPTVDLTQEMPQPLPPPRPVPPPMLSAPTGSPGGRPPGRPSARSRVTCQVCDKMFANPDALAVHMHSHRQGAGLQPPPSPQSILNSGIRSASKLPFECNLCTAQYPTQQGLMSHKQKYHNEPQESPDFVMPVVDLKQPGTLQRLATLGIRHFIPLAQLHNQGGGMFGLPIVSVDSARNPAVCNIGGIGASNLFPLGPMKSLR